MSDADEREANLFHAARLLTDAAQRAAFLDAACHGDPVLRHRLDALLTSRPEAEAFFAQVKDQGITQRPSPTPTVRATENAAESSGAMRIPAATSSQDGSDAPDEDAGATIGRYKLLQKIGEGGFGAVYMAQQKEPVKRRVALKIIKLGMDTRQVVARFEAERQALALMDHPNIARVFDAGTTDNGRPYFVMELVRGVQITEFCDENRLTASERLDLFIQGCRAIQHAHQKGIIHRDIKPSNILVTSHDGVPVPKVIDFGIAKATQQDLTDKTIFTQFSQFIGTPAYISPEQAGMSGLDIDTRSDIYSLGVLLYQLLTGKTPFDAKELLRSGLDEMCRTIRESEPPRPSVRLSQMAQSERTTTANQRRSDAVKLIHLLRGDLDWVVMKCLEKDRARRYETANGLAVDLEHYLKSEPVGARPPTTLYTVRRFVRRHRAASVATALVAATVVLGLGLSLRALRRERLALADSNQRRAEATSARGLAESNALVARHLAYVSDMNVAAQALRDGDLGRARALLRRHLPLAGATDMRGWEWRCLASECRGDPHVNLVGHTNRVVGVRFLDNDTLLSAGKSDRQVILWKHRDQQMMKRMTAYHEVSQFAVSSSGHGIFYSYWPPKVDNPRFLDWEVEADHKALLPTNFPGLCGVVISRSQHLMAVRTRTHVHILDLKADKRLEEVGFNHLWPNTVAFSPDERLLAVGYEDGQIGWWNIEGRKWETDMAKSHSPMAALVGLVFSPDGQWLISINGFGRGQVWDVATRSLKVGLEPRELLPALAFSPDGELLAVGAEAHTIHLIDIKTWKRSRSLRGHSDQIQDLDFSPDGRFLASCSRNGEVKVWPLKGPPPSRLEMTLENAMYMGFSSDGSAFFRVPTEKLEYSDIWSAPGLERLGRVALDDLTLPQGTVLPGGKSIAVGCADGSIHVRGATELTAEHVHHDSANVAGISADGRILATFGNDLMIRVWRLPDLEPIAARKTDIQARYAYMRVKLSPDGRRMAGLDGRGVLDIWELPEIKLLFRRQIFAAVENSEISFSRDGRLFVGSAEDRRPVIWDLAHAESPPLVLQVPNGKWPGAFSPDGTRMALAMSDMVKLFDVRSGEEVVSIPVQAEALDFSSDGESLTVVGQTKATVFRAPPLDQLDFDSTTTTPNRSNAFIPAAQPVAKP